MGFDEFWERYPKKRGKIAARKEYDKAVKVVGHDKIMAGLESFIQAEPWKGDKHFCIWPERWLKKGCWDDDHELPTAEEVEVDYEARERHRRRVEFTSIIAQRKLEKRHGYSILTEDERCRADKYLAGQA